MSDTTELLADATTQEMETEESTATSVEPSPLDARLEELDWLIQFEGPGLTRQDWKALSRWPR